MHFSYMQESLEEVFLRCESTFFSWSKTTQDPRCLLLKKRDQKVFEKIWDQERIQNVPGPQRKSERRT